MPILRAFRGMNQQECGSLNFQPWIFHHLDDSDCLSNPPTTMTLSKIVPKWENQLLSNLVPSGNWRKPWTIAYLWMTCFLNVGIFQATKNHRFSGLFRRSCRRMRKSWGISITSKLTVCELEHGDWAGWFIHEKMRTVQFAKLTGYPCSPHFSASCCPVPGDWIWPSIWFQRTRDAGEGGDGIDGTWRFVA